MKVLQKDKIRQNKLTRYAKTERNVMSVINHPFIVKLDYAFQTQTELFLILQFCPGGDLSEYLQIEKRFHEFKSRIYICEIILAIEELHRNDIIYRDLKPDNVVLDDKGHALLTDFGLSKEGVDQDNTKSFCGSYAYLAPEMVKKVGHGKAVDWYLLGVLLYEFLVGIPPYYDNDRDQLFHNIIHESIDLPHQLSSDVRDLLVKLLQKDPEKRLGTHEGAAEIKKHSWFRDVNWDDVYNRKFEPPIPYLKRKVEKGNGQIIIQKPDDAERERLLLEQDPNFITGWSFILPADEK